ncbi:MAG: Uma2 family endonuclease [Planctomycetes bacterium]|nr:Uma2 family endonuclease [Planctomycetota bacterium]
MISGDSRNRDHGEKFYEYEQGGVREYWMIDYEREQAEFHVLGEDGLYRPAPIGHDGIYRSTDLKGLWIKVDWLWQDPLPPVPIVLKESGLI